MSAMAAASLLSIYQELLACAQAQAGAVLREDWDDFGALFARRQELLAEGESILSSWQPSDNEPLAVLLRRVAAVDDGTRGSLEAKRDLLSREVEKFARQLQVLGAYGSRTLRDRGSFFDSNS